MAESDGQQSQVSDAVVVNVTRHFSRRGRRDLLYGLVSWGIIAGILIAIPVLAVVIFYQGTQSNDMVDDDRFEAISKAFKAYAQDRYDPTQPIQDRYYADGQSFTPGELEEYGRQMNDAYRKYGR